MPDIRSFFGPKGGAAPAKPIPKKEEEPAKKGRGKGRKVVEDSGDDDDDAVVEAKKPAKSTPKKKSSDPKDVKGVSTNAADYFGSSKAKPTKSESTPKAAKTQLKAEVELRQSPRSKKTPTQKSAATAKTKKPVTAYAGHGKGDDEDDYVDEDDEDAGDDIFAADAKGRNKRKNDEYVEEESEEEFLPKPKRVASRGKPLKDESDSDAKPTPRKSAAEAKSSANKKRKSPEYDEEEEDEEPAPRKKAAPSKPRAPKAAKKDDPSETDEVKAIMDNIPLVDAPDAPPKDPNAKFPFKPKGHANSGPAPMAGSAEIPDGEENCLMGKTFVFTGLLKTISRDEGQALVKRYGGKVTTAPSKNTDFVVLGDEAGPSKLRKIKELNIKTIDEHGLFYLIKNMPANGGTGAGAEKAKEKREKEEQKVKEAALEMETEERARKAEAEKAKKAAAARGAAAPPSSQAPPLSQLWTTKYAPTTLNHICGNKGNVEKIQNWLKNWPKSKKYDFQRKGADGSGGFRAIMVSGPPGIGKTTAAHLAAKLEGYDILESNASDTRSKKLVENGISDVVNNTSLLGFFAGDGKQVDAGKKKMVLIMDEVDGMSAGDRGGVGALAKFCKKTEVPLILICNERRLPKMKPFDFVTYDIKFTRPTVDQIRSRIMTICHREGLKMPPQVIDALIEGSNKDIRQIINMISTAKLDQTSMNYDQSKAMSKAWEKHVILKPWDICQKMLGGGLFAQSSKATLNDKIELYFNDHEFSFLMIQENYLRCNPSQLGAKGYTPREQNLRQLELVDHAAESISDGDLVDRMIHGPQQHWSLMPTHAVFSTVRPASFVAGQLMGSTFTSWLGNNSKTGKLGRFVREVHAHMRLKSSGDHNEIRQQYLPVLWHQLIKKLENEGKDCVPAVIELMDSYYLTREDFDSIKELGLGDQSEDHVKIDTQTKATFTRMYNSMSHPVPFMRASNVTATKKVGKEMPDLEEAIEEEDDAEVVEPVEVDEEDDIKGDKYIKQPKAKAKGGKKGGRAAAKDADGDEEVDKAPTKGKGKAKGRR
ncbi:DNA replication factor C, large subunit [Thozetella sp. PMI_491]|nr:DNA replication factor C, large subunit [Thozetella sp. PMI_491]